MKEKLLIMSWVLFLSLWIFIYSDDNINHQYSYNGWLLQNVIAAVSPDQYQVNTWSSDWDNLQDSVQFTLSEDAVSSVAVNTIVIPPPPRDSH